MQTRRLRTHTRMQIGDTCLVHYEGRLADDLQFPHFDSTYTRAEPTFVVLDDNVIRGTSPRAPHSVLRSLPMDRAFLRVPAPA